MGVSDEASDEIHREVSRATVAGMFYLRDVLELVVDGFDDESLASQGAREVCRTGA